MNKNNKKQIRESKDINQSKNKVDLGYNLELERGDLKDLKKKDYDFIPRFNHLVSLDEQKIKVEEIENKTK